MCQCQAVCKGFAFLYQGQRSPLLRRLSRLTPTHPKEHRLASQSPDERDNAPGNLGSQRWEQQGPQSHVIPWTCSSDKGQEVGMGRKMAAQRPGGAQAGIGTGTEVHTHVSTPVYLCAWASMQDHIPRDPALHPRSDAQRVWVEVTRWAGPPAADDSRVKPGMGFTVIAVGSGPLQRPPVPQTVDGGQW